MFLPGRLALLVCNKHCREATTQCSFAECEVASLMAPWEPGNACPRATASMASAFLVCVTYMLLEKT